jgi:putative redox protein
MKTHEDSSLEGAVTVRGLASAFTQTIDIRSHRIVADEPVAVGGTDAGPTPYDLLLAALGSCASMTVALYARRKGWPLQEVAVHLRHSRVHAVDCAECETTEGRLDRIDWSFQLTGELTGEQRTRLLEIAQRCPVHRTLISEIDVRPPVSS